MPLFPAKFPVWVWDVAPLPWNGGNVIAVDVTKPAQVSAGVDRILAVSRKIDILINNAGYGGNAALADAMDPSEWRKIIDTNLTSVFDVCRLVIPHMRSAGHGRIVNMASLAAKDGMAGLSAYSAASAGVVAFTKALGKELAETGIRVNCVTPAAIETDLIRQMGPEVVDGMIARSPMKRLGTVNEVAEMVMWLCSDACSFNSGSVFDLSGGRASY